MKRKNTVVYLSRFVIIFLSVIVQALVVWLIVYELKEKYFSFTIFLAFVGAVLFLSIVNRDQAAVYKLPWVILFIGIPFAGLMVYLTFGNVKLSKKHLRRFRGFYYEHLDEYYGQKELMSRLNAEDPRAAGEARYLRSVAYLPAFDNSDTTFLPTGEEVYACLKEELSKATKYVFLEYFIISEGKMWDGVHEILRRKAAAGVDVRMIYDDVGCASRLPAAYWRTLEREGIRAVPFNPFVPVLNMVMNSRDHRKIVAVDGSVAFTGGFNLADEYINREQRFGHWRDTAVRLEGPGAWNFAAMFLELWASQRPRDPGLDVMAPELRPAPQRTVGLVQPYADSPVDQENVAKNVYLELINQAQSVLWITTPYLILDNATLTALRLAAKRGVDVRIYVPGIPDKKMVYQLTKSFFAPLLRGGVKIFTYTPGFLHAKTWLVDGEIAAVGSINLDYRSLYLHFECSVLLYGCPALADIAADMMDIERVSHPVELSESRSGVLGTMVSAVLRLLAPLC